MSKPSPLTWLSGLLCALILLGWQFGKREVVNPLDAHTLSHSVDFIITDLTFHEFGPTGTLTRRVQTPRLQHIPFHNQFILDKPQLTFSDDKQSPWQLSAQHATTQHGFNEIHFNEQVALSQAASPTQPATTLNTESLTYFSKKDFLVTKHPVRLQQATHTLLSQGMTAHLKQQHIVLTQADAHLHPANQPSVHASANTMSYYPKKHLLVLENNAKIIQKNNTLTAPLMRYDLEKQQFLTDATAHEKTHLLFYMDKHHGNPFSKDVKKKL